MANHPYNQHREQQVAHRRVSTILNGSPAGAQKHATGHAFSKLTSKSAAVRDDDIAGKSGSKRYARGGKVKGDTNINIVIPGGGKPPMPMPMPMGGPPPGPGPGLPPPGGMPGMPPGGPPPGMPMRASGGRIAGEATEGNLKQWGKRASANSYFRGGAATGVGREEKAERAKRK
jgi:hypothetical protein